MSVRQRGNSYQADLTVKGTRYRGTFTAEAVAKEWETATKAALAAGKTPPDPATFSVLHLDPGAAGTVQEQQGHSKATGEGTLPLCEAASRCIARYWTAPQCSEEYASTVAYYLGDIERFFGKWLPVGAITAQRIDDYMAYCRDQKGNSNGTINRKLAIISKLLRYCEERGILDKRPKLERVKEHGKRLRWLSQEEEASFHTLFRLWGKDMHADALVVLVDTGLRNGELWRLEGRDVDLGGDFLTVWTNKTDLPRSIPMTKRVRAIIEKRVEVYGQGRLFPGLTNPAFRLVWERARAQLGFSNDPDMVPYICRHTCASRLVQNGISLAVIQKWLGHKSIQMTMRYAVIAPDNLKEAARMLDALEGKRP